VLGGSVCPRHAEFDLLYTIEPTMNIRQASRVVDNTAPGKDALHKKTTSKRGFKAAKFLPSLLQMEESSAAVAVQGGLHPLGESRRGAGMIRR